MEHRIYKYPITPENRDITPWSDLELPIGSKILSVGTQNNQLQVWVSVPVDNPVNLQTIRLWIIETGRPLPEPDLRFIGTVFDRAFVWHIFQEENNV